MEVLQYHIFGNESLIDTLGRASGILQETAVCFVWKQKIYSMQAACKRRRPNGMQVMCCGMEAIYVRQSITQCFFKCLNKVAHTGNLRFPVDLLTTKPPERWVLEIGTRRIIIAEYEGGEIFM